MAVAYGMAPPGIIRVDDDTGGISATDATDAKPDDDVMNSGDDPDWWLPGLDPIDRIYLEAEIGMGE